MASRRSFLSALAAGFAALKVGKVEAPIELPLGDWELEVIKPFPIVAEPFRGLIYYADDRGIYTSDSLVWPTGLKNLHDDNATPIVTIHGLTRS